MSPETCFLLYITRYLKYVLASWPHWVTACTEFQTQLGLHSSAWARQTTNDLGYSNYQEMQRLQKSCDEFAEQRLPSSGKSAENCPSFGESLSSNCSDELHPNHREPEMIDDHEVAISSSLVKEDDHICDKALVTYSSSSDENDGENADFKVSGENELQSFSVDTGRLLHFASELGGLGDCVEANEVLDKAMTVLVRFRISIERLATKKMFPFNVKPLLRLLECCEELYEEN